MRKVFMFLFLAISMFASAQTEQGSSLVGGNFSLRTGKNDSRVGFSPSYGYFFSNNFVAGSNLRLDYTKLGDVKSTTFGVGPFARYYFGSTNTKPFLNGQFDFLSATTSNANSKITTNGIGFLFGLGFAAFINETVAVEGLSGYRYSKTKGQSGSGGFALSIGFGLYFNRRSVQDLKSNVLGQ